MLTVANGVAVTVDTADVAAAAVVVVYMPHFSQLNNTISTCSQRLASDARVVSSGDLTPSHDSNDLIYGKCRKLIHHSSSTESNSSINRPKCDEET